MGISWVEYWDFLQIYIDMILDDGFDFLEEYLQKQSLVFCIEEVLGKLDLFFNSFYLFKYNQMDMLVNQSKDGIGSINGFWLMFFLIDIEEFIYEYEIVDIDKYLYGNIMDQVRCRVFNGIVLSIEVMKKLVRLDEFFIILKKNIYEYGRMNQFMEWFMDSSDWL